MRCLTYVAPGPRIASTPEESLIHPNYMYFKKLILFDNGLVILFQLLHSSVREVREQAVLAFGSLAAHNSEVRDVLLRHGILNELLSLVTTNWNKFFSIFDESI